MNAWEFDDLKAQITGCLSRLGPATAEKLAMDFGLWDLSDEVPSVAIN